MHVNQMGRGDGSDKHPCWISAKEDADPSKKLN